MLRMYCIRAQQSVSVPGPPLVNYCLNCLVLLRRRRLVLPLLSLLPLLPCRQQGHHGVAPHQLEVRQADWYGRLR
jgi:hypothetical protein